MTVPGPLTLGKGPFPLFNPGRQLIAGEDLNQLSASYGSNEAGKTATAGGGRANAYPIKAANTQFSVVANAADSCVLPASYPGLSCFIVNNGAQSLQVFGNGSDTFNVAGTAGSVGVAQAATVAVEYYCIVAGNWRQSSYV